MAVRAFHGGPLVGHELQDLRRHMPQADTRVVAIFRHDSPIVPEGKTVMEAGDEVFFLAATENIRGVLRELRRMDKPVKRVMIGGGGNIGRRLARAIEGKYSVKIIEFNRAGPSGSPRSSTRRWCWRATSPTRRAVSENVGEMDPIARSPTTTKPTHVSLLAKRLARAR